MVQNSADEAVKIATNTLNTCTRSGRGCENGIAVARQTAEQTASRLQNGADWLHSVSENMPSPETIGLVSTAISVHNAVSQGQLEADDICYDDEGISAMLPVVSRSLTLATDNCFQYMYMLLHHFLDLYHCRSVVLITLKDSELQQYLALQIMYMDDVVQ